MSKVSLCVMVRGAGAWLYPQAFFLWTFTKVHSGTACTFVKLHRKLPMLNLSFSHHLLNFHFQVRKRCNFTKKWWNLKKSLLNSIESFALEKKRKSKTTERRVTWFWVWNEARNQKDLEKFEEYFSAVIFIGCWNIRNIRNIRAKNTEISPSKIVCFMSRILREGSPSTYKLS